MQEQITVSAKGQIAIPKEIRNFTGIHKGSKLIINVLSEDKIELSVQKNDISSFFGMGKQLPDSNAKVDIDVAIKKAVLKNDKY